MSCIALSIATEGLARPFWPGPTALRSCTVPPRLRVPAQASPFLYPSLLGHREGRTRPRPAAQRAFAFPDSFPKASVGPLPHKAALGAWEQPSLASVPAECPE
jgi:hypothetical protein